MLTYKPRDPSKKDSPIKVFLDKKHVGGIRPKRSEFAEGVKWQYVPKGKKDGGEWFDSLEECKKSLEID